MTLYKRSFENIMDKEKMLAISIFQLYLFCQLQMLWIWTSLKFCCLVKELGLLVNTDPDYSHVHISLILVHTVCQKSHWLKQLVSPIVLKGLTLYLACQFWALPIQQQIKIIIMMSKLLKNGDTVFWLSRKHCWKRRNCSLRAISSFPTMFLKAVFCWCVNMRIYGVKG